jgi:hypothetical protein
MSSRSFRRRNNRRRHRAGAEGDNRQSQGQQKPSPADDGRQRGPQASDGRGRPRREGAQSGGQKREGPSTDLPRRDPPTIVVPDCPVCGKPLKELSSALTHRATGRPAHFDCIMREIRDANELAPQEKLCYLGGGCFGRLEFRQPGVTGKFVIRKRIPYEERETPQEWKKTLLVSC